MGRFVEGADRSQLCFLPECLDDWVDDDNPVQVIEAFVEALDLPALGFDGATPANTGGPVYQLLARSRRKGTLVIPRCTRT